MLFFGAGLITLSASIALRWFAARSRLNGKAARCDEIPYQHKYSRDTSTYIFKSKYCDKLLIGIDLPKGIECVFRKENWLDRIFKALWLTKEHQTGHREFDKQVYFISDNPAVQNLVSTSPTMAQSVLKFMACDLHGARFKSLRGYNGQLLIEYKLPAQLPEPAVTRDIASFVVKDLYGIANEFEQSMAHRRSRWLDRYYWIALLLSIIATGLLMNGLALLALQWMDDVILLPNDTIHLLTLVITIAGTSTLVLISALLLMRTSRAHYTLLEVLLAGGVGIYGTAYANIRDYNITQDQSPPTVVTTRVIDKQKKSNFGKEKDHYVTLSGNQHMPAVEVRVNSGFYASVRANTQLRIDWHPGRMGYPWITNLRRADSNERTDWN